MAFGGAFIEAILEAFFEAGCNNETATAQFRGECSHSMHANDYATDVWTARAAVAQIVTHDEPGVAEGLAASFDTTAYGPKGPSRFAPDSFDKTVRNRPEVPLLWSHDDAKPIGLARLRVVPGQGLVAKARLAIGIPQADEALALMKLGAVNGLSIGFTPRAGSLSEKVIDGDRVRVVGEADVMEVSLVVFPADRTATVKWMHRS